MQVDPRFARYLAMGATIQTLSFTDGVVVFAIISEWPPVAIMIEGLTTEFGQRYYQIAEELQVQSLYGTTDAKKIKTMQKHGKIAPQWKRHDGVSAAEHMWNITPYPFDRCTAEVHGLPVTELVMMGMKLYCVDISRDQPDGTVKLYLSGGDTRWEVRDMNKSMVALPFNEVAKTDGSFEKMWSAIQAGDDQ